MYLSLRMTKTLVLAFCLILSLLNNPPVCPPTSQSIGVWRLFLQIFAKNIFAKLNVSKNANKRRMRNFETFTFCVSEWVSVCVRCLYGRNVKTLSCGWRRSRISMCDMTKRLTIWGGRGRLSVYLALFLAGFWQRLHHRQTCVPTSQVYGIHCLPPPTSWEAF